MVLNILFYQRNPEDFNENKGGVQRVVRLLENSMSSYVTKIYLVSGSPSVSPSVDVYYLPDRKCCSPKNIISLRNFIAEKEITHVINQDGLDLDVLKLMSNIQPFVRIIAVHHNCVQCLIDSYENIFRNNRYGILSNVVDKLLLWNVIRIIFRRRLRYVFEKVLLKSDAVVVLFDEFKNEVESLLGRNCSNLHVIPNPNTYQPVSTKKPSSKRIIYVGRIEQNQKRVDKLLALWTQLHADLPDWNFDLVGDGDYLETVREIVQNFNLDRVKIHGWQDPLDLWKKADIFTLTSDFEGYGLVIVEAQSMGVIPVSFPCYSAIGEVINTGVSGIVLEDFSVDRMRNTILQLISSKDEMQRIREGLQTGLKQFDGDRIARLWLKLLVRYS